VQVPVLVDGELQITESPVVAEYVLRRYGAETDILPPYPAAAAKAKLWAELWGTNVGPAQSAILQSDTKAKLEEAERKMVRSLTVMDAFLRSQGSDDGGDFFLGKQYSVAEVLTTSLLQRALVYCKAYRGVDLWRLVADAKLARLEAWMKAAMERPSAKETMPDHDELVAHGKKFTVPMQEG
jgi:glutathione S-transferase